MQLFHLVQLQQRSSVYSRDGESDQILIYYLFYMGHVICKTQDYGDDDPHYNLKQSTASSFLFS